MTRSLRQILDLLGAERRKLPWLILFFLGSSSLDFIGVGLIGPYVALVADPRALDGVLGNAIQAIGMPREQRTALMLIGLLLVAVFVSKAIAAIGIHGAIIRFGQNQQKRLQSSLMHAYQHLPYTEFLRRNSSEYVYAIEGLTAEFAYLVQMVLRAASDAILTLVLLGLLAWQNAPALALLVTLLLMTIYGYDQLFRRRLWSYGERVSQASMTVVKGVHEGIEGLKEIRVLGKEAHFQAMVDRGASEHARFHALGQLINAAPRYLLELAMVAFVVILVLLTLWLGNDLEALIPTIGMFGVAALRLLPAVNTFSTSLVRMRYSRDAVARLHRDVAALSSVRLETPGAVDGAQPEPFEMLNLERVRFSYPGTVKPALDDLSLHIRAHEAVGLIGASGSGKTTLVDVLLGLLEPQEGEWRYNGRPLRGALAEWRSQVAYLPQDVFLVDDTLRRNVAFGIGETDIDERRIEEALRQARLAEFIAQLPEGVQTVVGERGVRLSGGQRQRVALARAFYHGRDVLVMDEATSALDTDTEREIVEEIRRLKGEKTLIVIAHRLSTVQHCDRICRLAAGRVVEEGTYNEVLGTG